MLPSCRSGASAAAACRADRSTVLRDQRSEDAARSSCSLRPLALLWKMCRRHVLPHVTSDLRTSPR